MTYLICWIIVSVVTNSNIHMHSTIWNGIYICIPVNLCSITRPSLAQFSLAHRHIHIQVCHICFICWNGQQCALRIYAFTIARIHFKIVWINKSPSVCLQRVGQVRDPSWGISKIAFHLVYTVQNSHELCSRVEAYPIILLIKVQWRFFLLYAIH